MLQIQDELVAKLRDKGMLNVKDADLPNASLEEAARYYNLVRERLAQSKLDAMAAYQAAEAARVEQRRLEDHLDVAHAILIKATAQAGHPGPAQAVAA